MQIVLEQCRIVCRGEMF